MCRRIQVFWVGIVPNTCSTCILRLIDQSQVIAGSMAPNEVTAPHLNSTPWLQQISSPLCATYQTMHLLPPSLPLHVFYCYFSWTSIADCPHPHCSLFSALTTLPCTLRHCLSMLCVYSLWFFLLLENTTLWAEITSSSVNICHLLMELDQVLILARTEMKGQCCSRWYGDNQTL